MGVVPSPLKQIIRSWWIFQIKTNSNGSNSQYKVHLVAKGYSQIERVDYGEIFSPMVKFNFIQIILDWQVNMLSSYINLMLKQPF
jgi:hypothetical protein